MRLLAILGVVGLLAAAPAAAHRRYHFTAGLHIGPTPDRWLLVAARYWDVTLSCPPSTVKIIWDEPLLDSTPYGRVFGMANLGACWDQGIWPGEGRKIWLNPYYLNSTQRKPDGSPYFDETFWCKVTTHEYGHLIGLNHSTDPNSIMSTNLPNVPVEGC